MDGLGLYLNEIGKVTLLTAQEERDLAIQITVGEQAPVKFEEAFGKPFNINLPLRRYVENPVIIEKLPDSADPLTILGNIASLCLKEIYNQTRSDVEVKDVAKDRFIRANLRLVVSIAKRFPLPPGMELLDLIQDGNLGLEHAVDKFDWRKGFKFSTYATFWIRQSIGRALDNTSALIRVPGAKTGSLRAELRHLQGDADQLSEANSRVHTLTTPVSLNKPLTADGDVTLGDYLESDLLSPEDALIATMNVELLNELLDGLDRRTRYVVEERFGLLTGEPASFTDLSSRMGITGEAVRRMVVRGIKAMREKADEMRNEDIIREVGIDSF